VHVASKYRGGYGALTNKFLPAANAPGRCLACSRLSGIVAIALVVMFEFALERRTLDWSITFNSGATKHLLDLLFTRCRDPRSHPLAVRHSRVPHTCRRQDPVGDWLCGCRF